jgi:hypothetical protein
MKSFSSLLVATSIFLSLLNWQCSPNRQVEPKIGLSGQYNINQLTLGDSTYNNPLAYIATTEISRNQIQIFFASNLNGKESSKDFSNFDIEPIDKSSYAILKGGTRVGLIDLTSFSLDLDANSPNRFYVKARK